MPDKGEFTARSHTIPEQNHHPFRVRPLLKAVTPSRGFEMQHKSHQGFQNECSTNKEVFKTDEILTFLHMLIWNDFIYM
jgi:hypothetical protein